MSSSQRYGSSTAAAAVEEGGDMIILFAKGPEKERGTFLEVVAGNLLGEKAEIWRTIEQGDLLVMAQQKRSLAMVVAAVGSNKIDIIMPYVCIMTFPFRFSKGEKSGRSREITFL